MYLDLDLIKLPNFQAAVAGWLCKGISAMANHFVVGLVFEVKVVWHVEPGGVCHDLAFPKGKVGVGVKSDDARTWTVFAWVGWFRNDYCFLWKVLFW